MSDICLPCGVFVTQVMGNVMQSDHP